mgnify:CR=1 FL=1
MRSDYSAGTLAATSQPRDLAVSSIRAPLARPASKPATTATVRRIAMALRGLLRQSLLASVFLFAITVVPSSGQQLRAQDIDLVVNITSDQPAYMAQDLQSFSVTTSNNGPDTATGVDIWWSSTRLPSCRLN